MSLRKKAWTSTNFRCLQIHDWKVTLFPNKSRVNEANETKSGNDDEK